MPVVCLKVQDSLVCRDVSGDGVAWWDVGGGMMWEFDLGAWADATTALAALVALYFARKAWIASQANAHAALRMLELEQKRESRAEQREIDRLDREARAEQADLVAVWVELDEASTSFEQTTVDGRTTVTKVDVYRLHARNASPLPVYGLAVDFLGDDGDARGEYFRNVLPPGELVDAMPSVELRERVLTTAEGDPLEYLETPTDLKVSVFFQDTAQRAWARAVDGSLTPVDLESDEEDHDRLASRA